MRVKNVRNLPAPGAEDADPLFIRSVAKAMEVLRCISEAPSAITVSDVAAQTGLTQPNVWRICYTLRSLGYLRTTPSGEIRPGLPLLRFGYAALATDSVHKIVKPYLTELAERFRAAAGVAVRDGQAMLYLERSDGDAMLSIKLRPGSTVPLIASAMGWAYLSAIPDDERARLLDEARREDHERWTASIKKFEAAYQEAKSDGFILCVGVYHPAVGMAGTTMRHPRTGTLYTINCGGLSSLLTPTVLRNEVGPALRRATEQIEPLLASVADAGSA